MNAVVGAVTFGRGALAIDFAEMTGKYVFQDVNSNIVKELDADEMQAFLKELDVDPNDMTWRGERVILKRR